jgi:monocyte to macrophage differentiation protein
MTIYNILRININRPHLFEIFHEKYKSLETILYLMISIGPASVVILCGHEFVAMSELKIGGFLYLFGVFFFKADGKLSCAHAIWHLFVVVAASVHYIAILKYLYSEQYILDQNQLNESD